MDRSEGKPEVVFQRKSSAPDISEKDKAYLRLLAKDKKKLSRKDEKKLKMFETEFDSASKSRLMIIKMNDVFVRPSLKVVPERSGEISLSFEVVIPDSLLNDRWEVVVEPNMIKGDSVYDLEKVVFQGKGFRAKQKSEKAKQKRYIRNIKRLHELEEGMAQKQANIYSKRMEHFYREPVFDNSQLKDTSAHNYRYNDLQKINKRKNRNNDLIKGRSSYFKNKKRSARETVDKRNTKPKDAKYYTYLKESKKTEKDNPYHLLSSGDIYKDASYQTLQKQRDLATYFQSRHNRYVKEFADPRNLPRQENIRLDSVVDTEYNMRYYYSQTTSTNQDFDKYIYVNVDSYIRDYDGRTKRLPSSDTIKFKISSMDNFIDETPHFVYQIVERVALVNDKSKVIFPVAKSKVIDTLYENKKELAKIMDIMGKLLDNDEFVVDSITLTAMSSPEGSYALNNKLAKERAYSLRDYIVKRHGAKSKKLLTVQWVGENWPQLIDEITNENNLKNKPGIFNIISKRRNLDRREVEIRSKYPRDYAYIKDSIYPRLRVIDFNYYLHRKGMIKDTIHTTNIDSVYLKGVGYLKKHEYRRAIKALSPYGEDFNRGIALMSLGFNKSALRIFNHNKESANGEYLKSILYARFEKYLEAYNHFKRACELNERLVYRGNLDPEIQNMLNNAAVEILKQEDDSEKEKDAGSQYYY
ncbi:MAG: hypothetical protein IMY73_05050 [Bacteroidetes bacterium]|nr:hypothetical protein [Bacteroidota bacterium]